MRHLLLASVLTLLIACSEQVPEGKATEPAPESFRLPVSINDVMVALINDAADPIWVAAWHEPKTDAQWRDLERRAYQLKLGGSLIAYPGTGGLDDKWTAKPAWRKWSDQLRDAGSEAIVAIQARDADLISKSGDKIVEVCEGCHVDFKLAFPTGGKFGELSPNAADLEE